MAMDFEKWFHEQQAFSLRSEWFYEEMDLLTGGGPQDSIVKWLKAAYEEGYGQARYDTMKLYWDDGK